MIGIQRTRAGLAGFRAHRQTDNRQKRTPIERRTLGAPCRRLGSAPGGASQGRSWWRDKGAHCRAVCGLFLIAGDHAKAPAQRRISNPWRHAFDRGPSDPATCAYGPFAQEQIDLNDGERGFQRIWDKVQDKRGGKDNQRQSRAWKEIVKIKREGCDYEETKVRLLDFDDQGVVDWVNERGLKDDERELKDAFEKIHVGSRGSNKPEIFWSGETDDEACT